MAWLGGGDSETSEVKQTVALPAGKSARLVFFYYIASKDTCNHDVGYARVIVNGVTHDLRKFDLCIANSTGAWVSAQYDLSAYAGKNATVVFRVQNNSTIGTNSNLFIDDTRLISGACTALSDLDNQIEPETPIEPADSTSVQPQQAGADAPRP